VEIRRRGPDDAQVGVTAITPLKTTDGYSIPSAGSLYRDSQKMSVDVRRRGLVSRAVSLRTTFARFPCHETNVTGSMHTDAQFSSAESDT